MNDQNKFILAEKFVYLLPIIIVVTAILAPRFLAYLPGIVGVAGMGFCLHLKLKPVFFKRAYIWASILLGAMVLSALWTINLEFSLERTGKLFMLLFTGLLLPSVFLTLKDHIAIDPKKLIVSMVATACVSSIALFIEYHLNGPIYGLFRPEFNPDRINFSLYNKSFEVLALLIVLAFGMTRFMIDDKRTKRALYLAMTLSIALFWMVTESQTSQFGLVIGCIIVFLTPLSSRVFWIGLFAVIVIGSLGAPFISKQAARIDFGTDYPRVLRKASIPDRIQIWNFISNESLKKPIFGHGVGSSRFIQSDVNISRYRRGKTVLHPHNSTLQIWLEFGISGIVLFLAGIGLLLKYLYSVPEPERRISLAMMLSYMAMSLTGYGMWQGWLIGVLMLYLGFAVLQIHVLPKTKASA